MRLTSFTEKQFFNILSDLAQRFSTWGTRTPGSTCEDHGVQKNVKFYQYFSILGYPTIRRLRTDDKLWVNYFNICQTCLTPKVPQNWKIKFDSPNLHEYLSTFCEYCVSSKCNVLTQLAKLVWVFEQIWRITVRVAIA